MTTTTADRLRQTVRVGVDPNTLPWGGVGMKAGVQHGVKVKVTAVNRPSGDIRLLAASPRVVHTRRFAPGGIPKGVDLNITTAHHVCSPQGLGCPQPVAE